MNLLKKLFRSHDTSKFKELGELADFLEEISTINEKNINETLFDEELPINNTKRKLFDEFASILLVVENCDIDYENLVEEFNPRITPYEFSLKKYAGIQTDEIEFSIENMNIAMSLGLYNEVSITMKYEDFHKLSLGDEHLKDSELTDLMDMFLNEAIKAVVEFKNYLLNECDISEEDKILLSTPITKELIKSKKIQSEIALLKKEMPSQLKAAYLNKKLSNICAENKEDNLKIRKI